MAGTTVNVRAMETGGSNHETTVNLNKLVDDVENLRRAVSYMMPGVVLTAPATKTGTTSAKAWRNEAFTYATRGLIESKAAAETAFTATTHDVAASKEAWFVLSIAAGGTLTITKAADQTIGTVVLPSGPDNQVVVAYLQIVTGTTGFDATTDDLAVAGTIITSLTFTDAPAVAAAGLTAAKVANGSGTVIA